MDKEFLHALKTSLDASSKLQACQKKQCPKEYAESDKQAKALIAKVMALIEQFNQKKITLATFTKQSKKLREEAMSSEVSQHLMQCSLSTCESLLRNMMKASADILSYTCKHDKKKKDCSHLKKIQTILKKKELTVTDCIDFLKLLIQNA